MLESLTVAERGPRGDLSDNWARASCQSSNSLTACYERATHDGLSDYRAMARAIRPVAALCLCLGVLMRVADALKVCVCTHVWRCVCATWRVHLRAHVWMDASVVDVVMLLRGGDEDTAPDQVVMCT